MWTYLIKKEFIKKNKLTFLPCVNFQDIEFTTKALFLAKTVSLKKITAINYVQRKGSALNDKKRKYFHYHHLKITESFIKFYKENRNIDSRFINEIKHSFLRSILDASYYDYKDILKFNQKLKKVILFGKSINNKKLNFFLSLLKFSSLVVIYGLKLKTFLKLKNKNE